MGITTVASSQHTWTYTRQRTGLGRWLLERLGVSLVEYSPRRRLYDVRARWGSAAIQPTRSKIGVGLCLICWGSDSDEDRRWSAMVAVPFASFYVSLPSWFMPETRRSGNWGAQLSSVDTEFPSQLYLQWGKWYKFIDMPWALYSHRHSMLLSTGNWYHRNHTVEALRRLRLIGLANRLLAQVGLRLPVSQEPRPDGLSIYQYEKSLSRYTETHPYVYVLKSGEAQDVVATVTVDEWELRRRFLFWTPLLARVRRSINVKFSGEVGEERGSWKGGVVGTSHEMLPGELPVHAIARMQQERRF